MLRRPPWLVFRWGSGSSREAAAVRRRMAARVAAAASPRVRSARARGAGAGGARRSPNARRRRSVRSGRGDPASGCFARRVRHLAQRGGGSACKPDRPNPTDPPDHSTHPTDASRASGGLLVTVVGSLAPTQMGEWRAGRRVRFPVELRRPSRYLDPGVPEQRARAGAAGDDAGRHGEERCARRGHPRGTWFDEAMAQARAFARRAIAGAVGRWSPESAGIVAAIVIGDRAGLGDDMERRLQEAGTYHVIAISGGNIAILAGLLLGVFRLAGRLGRTAMIASIAVLIVYARLVGNGASVDRATLMAVVYFGARAFDQRSPPLNTLALVGRDSRGVGPARRRRSRVHPDLWRHPRHPHDRAGDDDVERRVRRERREQALLRDLRGLGVDCRDRPTGGGDVRGVGSGRGRAVPGRRARVLARDLRRARAELPRDPADGRRADRGDGGRAGGDRVRAIGGGRRVGRPHRCRGSGPLGRSRPVCAGADLAGRAAIMGRDRRLLRSRGRLLGAVETPPRRQRLPRSRPDARDSRDSGRRDRCHRGVDSRQPGHARRRARRRGAARHVHRRRTG